MFRNIVKTIFGDPIERAIGGYQDTVEKIDAQEAALQKLDN